MTTNTIYRKLREVKEQAEMGFLTVKEIRDHHHEIAMFVNGSKFHAGYIIKQGELLIERLFDNE